MATNMPGSDAANGGGDASWRDSYKTAQMVVLPDVTSICGQHAGQLVHDLVQGVGCPEEFVLMPLLSCCSALMGHRSEIRVHCGWSEPPVLWTVVGAGGGTRKSAALRQVLMPLLALTEEEQCRQSSEQPQHHPQPLQDQEDGASSGLSLPSVYMGELNKQQLRKMLHERQGRLLHISERLEDCHKMLGMHVLQEDALKESRPQLQDLYEAFAGNWALPVMPEELKECRTSRGGERSPPTLCSSMSYTQCGFASPEYLVNLTIKAPHWLSGRFLITCPAVDETNFLRFHPSRREDSESGEDSSSEPPRAKKAKRENKHKLKLKDVYQKLAQAHSQTSSPRVYEFTKDAVSELQRFQEEEWCTIVNQLGGQDNGGVVGKSLGQIVRLAGVLKALGEACKPAVENGLSFSSELTMSEDSQVTVTSEDVRRAVELGKYFLEQKLSMTFMVSTGFFHSSSSTTPGGQEVVMPTPPPPSPAVAALQGGLPPPHSTSLPYSTMPNPGSVYGGGGFPNSKQSAAPASPAASSSPASSSSAGVGGGGRVPTSSPHHPHTHPHHPHHPQHPPQSLASGSLGPPPPPPPHPSLNAHPFHPFHNMFTGGPGSHQLPSFPMLAASGRGNLLPSFSLPPHPHSSSSSASSPSITTSASEIDVATLPATWIPASPEEELAEMSQAAEFAQLEPTQFVAVHARRVKRLLECFDDGWGVSATTAAQKSIAPPVRVAGTNNRHPAWASALFFQKVAALGLGIAEQVRHPTNGRVYWRFRRKPMGDLTEKNLQLLQYLRIDMTRFSRIGQSTLNMAGLELEAVPDSGGGASERSLVDEDVSNSSSGGGVDGAKSASVAGELIIKQELL